MGFVGSGLLKLNCDTSRKRNVDLIAIAVVAGNSNDNLVDGIAKRVYCSSPLVGKAQAMLEALRLTAAIGISSFIIETDSTSIYSAMLDSYKDVYWEIQAAVNLMCSLVPNFGQVYFSLVNKEANSIADIVAKLCFKNLLPCNWLLLHRLKFLIVCFFDAFVVL
ncbi:uncharacterized protein LOC110656721 [Hevea brasiliensis]|uniref:uncharacterized protein LOC110656721 n=1 Tax=Hevea brasiliensis TaxID=3981 RepID=UPI0025EE8203|nr:uncharacterized protein LOC110656721 [Hevea brasiliensis]